MLPSDVFRMKSGVTKLHSKALPEPEARYTMGIFAVNKFQIKIY